MQKTLVAPNRQNGNSQHTNRPDEQIAAIYKTFDYEKFTVMPNNRPKNGAHLRRLIHSFEQEHLISACIVNERFEIIDGQHRVAAAKETKKPVYYFIVHGYGIKQVQRLNTNQKDWGKMEYLHSYCAEGRKPYLDFRAFMNHFQDFGIQATERIITGLASQGKGTRKKTILGHAVAMRDFEDGNLVIPNLEKSYLVARKILEFKPFYVNYHRGTFVSCLLPLLNSKVYNHKEMLHKLGNCPIRLKDQDTVQSYRVNLEEIYNYKRQKEGRVSFKYL